MEKVIVCPILQTAKQHCDESINITGICRGRMLLISCTMHRYKINAKFSENTNENVDKRHKQHSLNLAFVCWHGAVHLALTFAAHENKNHMLEFHLSTV